MADNYLEKKFEQMREGHQTPHRQVKSLDTLLKCISDGVRPMGFAGEHSVKPAQVQAIIRSVSIAGFPDAVFKEGEACVEIGGLDSFDLGRAMQIILLKAAELRISVKISGNKALFSK